MSKKEKLIQAARGYSTYTPNQWFYVSSGEWAKAKAIWHRSVCMWTDENGKPFTASQLRVAMTIFANFGNHGTDSPPGEQVYAKRFRRGTWIDTAESLGEWLGVSKQVAMRARQRLVDTGFLELIQSAKGGNGFTNRAPHYAISFKFAAHQNYDTSENRNREGVFPQNIRVCSGVTTSNDYKSKDKREEIPAINEIMGVDDSELSWDTGGIEVAIPGEEERLQYLPEQLEEPEELDGWGEWGEPEPNPFDDSPSEEPPSFPPA